METTDDKMKDPDKSTPEEKPPMDGMTSEADGMTPAADSMTSEADGMTPVANPMTPVANPMTLEADAMTPIVDSMTTVADDSSETSDETPKTKNEWLKKRVYESRYDPGDEHDFLEKYCCTCIYKLYIFTSRIRLATLDGIESNFYKLGVSTATRPGFYMIASVVIFFFGFGMKSQDGGVDEMQWIPKVMTDDMKTSKRFMKWEHHRLQVVDGFRSDIKAMILVDNRILTPKGILEMYHLHKMLMEGKTQSGLEISYACKSLCKFESLLSLWNYNETVIRKLTKEQILAAVNFFDRTNYHLNAMLHVSKRDASGKIIEADATKMVWKFTEGLTNKEWDDNFTNRYFHNNPSMFNELHPLTSSYYEAAGLGFTKNILFIALGYTIMIFYIIMALGKCNKVDHKLGLAFSGLLCIVIGYFVTLGVCGAFGIQYSVLNRILPLLLLGVGVDDMLVIVGALNNLPPLQKTLPVEKQIGLTMKHAGVSITITTLSDIMAFGIGATSAFPGLRSFCIYNCVGILSIYILEITLFSCCVGLDLHRVMDRRDALFCCHKYKKYSPNRFSTIGFLEIIFLNLSKRLLTKMPIKILVMLSTVGLCVFCAWNIYYLEVQNTYVRILYSIDHPFYSYAEADENYFAPLDTSIYCSDLHYSTEQVHYLTMSRELMEVPQVDAERSMNWMSAFHHWARKKNPRIKSIVPPAKFDSLLVTYLWSAEGWPLRNFIEVLQKKNCSVTSEKSNICTKKICEQINSPFAKRQCMTGMHDNIVSRCACNMTNKNHESLLLCMCDRKNCTGKILKDSSSISISCYPNSDLCYEKENVFPGEIQCYSSSSTYPLSKILLKTSFSNGYKEKLVLMHNLEDISEKYYKDSCEVHSRYYIQWKINAILEWEIKRNLCLAFMSVFVITSMMIMNWKTSLMVVISVIFTMVDICGFLRVWGLYVDTTSCVIITLAVGLVFDFSVHIGFTFMTMKGLKNDRMIITLKEMGPPVFHGGFSTFLAVVPLALGDTYPFQTFFKVMCSVIFFGLYHGLIFLPVMLSLYAPPPYPSAKSVYASMRSMHREDFVQVVSPFNNKSTTVHPTKNK